MEGFLGHLQQAIGPQRFDVWFADAAKIEFTDTVVEVGVPNLFISDYLQAHFSEAIEKAALTATGRRLRPTFRIHPELFQKYRKDTLEAKSEFIRNPAPAGRAFNISKGAPRTGVGDSYRAFTLENFVVGPCNRIAYAAALNAAACPGVDFNPLFIHGASGLGKTHLLQGILHTLKSKYSQLRSCYLSAEAFTNQYIMSMQTGSLDGFRHRYRNLNVLVIDDVHFLGGKSATQEEFLHTFNAFDTTGKLVILASDAHPRQIERIQQQLVSRWISGMVARLSAPDLATRHAILKKKADVMGRRLPGAVITLMAERVTGSVRELEGALTKLLAFAALERRPITVSMAEEALADLQPVRGASIRIQDIEEAVCGFFALSTSDIRSRRKGRQISLARHVIMYLARKLTPLSFPEIGRLLGGKNHSTVISACRKIENMAKQNQPLRWIDSHGQHEMLLETLVDAISDGLRP
ncbi:MAG: chromosomal replication initiator protein DnaA [Planctomycetia bacterium]|nr:chromosomal replication initiator protein DnaA [Planctomycetia bacterium]